MNERDALLAAMRPDFSLPEPWSRYDDDTPRLALADWLDEYGDEMPCPGPCREYGSIGKVPDDISLRKPNWLDCPICFGSGSINPDRARAEFIRVQCELAKYYYVVGSVKHYYDVDDMKENTERLSRVVFLERREGDLLQSGWFQEHRDRLKGSIDVGGSRQWYGAGTSRLTIYRGFLARVRCSWEDWSRHGDAIVGDGKDKKGDPWVPGLDEVELTTWPTLFADDDPVRIPGYLVDGVLQKMWPAVRSWKLPA